MFDQDILKQLEKADVARAKAYAKDLEQGLKIVRTYPQGVTVFGSARSLVRRGSPKTINTASKPVN